MIMRFLTCILAAIFIASPVFAQKQILHLDSNNNSNGKIIAVEENYSVKPDGNLVVERTVLKQHDDNIAIQAVDTETPVLVYDGIEEPLFIDNAKGADIPTADSPRVIYHFSE